MYYYYWATAAGYKIWWKQYVTVLQISQFILDLGLVYFGSTSGLFYHIVRTVLIVLITLSAYSHFAYTRGWKPCVGDCAGSEFAALQGCAILSSYLVLFIMFYRKTYKNASLKKAVRDSQTANGKKPVANGKANGRARSSSIVQAQEAADSIMDATCGPAGVNLRTEGPGSGANTPVMGLSANGKRK
jgi:fatty acid elongase 3